MTSTRIGYARVSTTDQDPALQIDALQAAGCGRIFIDTASGSLRERPELARAIDYLREGDVLTVWRLDRLGRSLRHLIDTLADFQVRGVHLVSLSESIDTSTPTGRLILHVFGSLAEFERDLIVERTRAGLAAARARGRVGGRPAALTPEKVRVAQQLFGEKHMTVTAIADLVGCSRATLYRYLRAVV